MSPGLATRVAMLTSRGDVRTPDDHAGHLGRASVVIPCYKYGRYLPAAVAAALDQPRLDVQVVIVDDASPDDSGEVADRLAADDPRVTVVHHRVNQGHITTYNDGFEVADGDWVALVSADDLLTPGSLTRAAALMAAQPDVGFVYGRARHFASTPPAPELDVSHWITWSGSTWLEQRCRHGNNVIASPEVLMRGEVLRDVGGYRHDLPHSGDLEMWMRAATRADVGYLVGPDQAFYRQHETNMHKTVFQVGDREAAVVDLSHRWAAYRTVLAEPAGPVADLPRLDALARRTLGQEALDGAASARSHGMPPVTVDGFVELARSIDPKIPAEPRVSRRLVRRVLNRVRGQVRWWRLSRVGT